MTKEQKVRVVFLFIRNLWNLVGILAVIGVVAFLFVAVMDKMSKWLGSWFDFLPLAVIVLIFGSLCLLWAKWEVEEDKKP